jgi:hypothetical protein
MEKVVVILTLDQTDYVVCIVTFAWVSEELWKLHHNHKSRSH